MSKEYDGYSAQYEAFYYIDTFQWGEAGCKDPECEYCRDRPETAEGLRNDIATLKVGATIYSGYLTEDE